MSYTRPYPLPRRIALVLGLTLVRWARGSATARTRDADRSAPMLERAAAPPASQAHSAEPSTMAHSAESSTTVHSMTASASTSELTAADHSSRAQGAETAYTRQAEARARAIRQHQVDRQVEAERLRAEQRAFFGPVHR